MSSLHSFDVALVLADPRSIRSYTFVHELSITPLFCAYFPTEIGSDNCHGKDSCRSITSAWSLGSLWNRQSSDWAN